MRNQKMHFSVKAKEKQKSRRIEMSGFLPSRSKLFLVKQEFQMASLEKVGHEDDAPLIVMHGMELNLSTTKRVRAIKSAITKKFNLDYL